MQNIRTSKHKKYSIGAIVCRRYENIPQVLLVKRRITYAFSEFIFKNYRYWDNKRIKGLFERMSTQEKCLILSRDFDKIWYHIFLELPDKQKRCRPRSSSFGTRRSYRRNTKIKPRNRSLASAYKKCKSVYESFMACDIKRIHNLIRSNKSEEPSWEIPKGRLDPGETEVDCAMREVVEETGVLPGSFDIWSYKPMVLTTTTETTTYVNKYYLANTIESCGVTCHPHIDYFDTNQINEISDVKWVGLSKINHMKLVHPQMKKVLKKVLNMFKKNFPVF